jgi:hypothetical protein
MKDSEYKLSLLISIYSQFVLSVIVKNEYLALFCLVIGILLSIIYFSKTFKK